MALTLPKVIGHRGACAYAPENTLESLHAASDLNVTWVEFDVKLTSDGIPVLFHDDTLERTTNGSGNMADTPYAELQNLECGSWFADSFTGIKIPTLEEAVEVCLQHDLGMNVEFKPCPGREKETAEIALDHLSQIWDENDKLLISSFQHVCLEAARDMMPDWNRGLLLGGEELDPKWKDLADYLDVKTVNVGSNLAKREVIEDIIDEDLHPLIYTVNDPMEARKYQSWGVASMFSDCPDVIAENLLTVH
ncbi:MAG: glycerophosphoryl diester phosphodiesterase [Alphaproteobacteria bacterium]|nr:glycerophosphoryl diester phosphodiesterase [Alphaproteobacteria bacterium]